MEDCLCLNWKDHSSTYASSLSYFKSQVLYDDATVLCGNNFFPVHRIVLSACSSYFNEIFKAIQGKHPVIVLKDMSADIFEYLLCFMYSGEVLIEKKLLNELMDAAMTLQIKGFSVGKNEPSTSSSISLHSPQNDTSECNLSVQRKRKNSNETNDSSEPFIFQKKVCNYNLSSSKTACNEASDVTDVDIVVEVPICIKEEDNSEPSISDVITTNEYFPMLENDNTTLDSDQPQFHQNLQSCLTPENLLGLPKSPPRFNIFSNVKQFLESSKKGMLFISSYQSLGYLTKQARMNLVSHIIEEILEYYDKVKGFQWTALSHKIVELFPTEIPYSYFIPPHTLGDKKLARGKLIERFRNQLKIRKQLLKHSQESTEGNN